MSDEFEATGGGAAEAIREIERMAREGLEIRAIENMPEGSDPALVVPKGFQLEYLETLLPAPVRCRRKPEFLEIESFIAYVLRFECMDISTVYVNTGQPLNVTGAVCAAAVIDHARANGNNPAIDQWHDHIARYLFPYSPEWLTWTGKNGNRMPQLDFARFLEENATDIIKPEGDEYAPDAAAVNEVALHLEVKRNVEFSSATRLDSGDHSLNYKEESAAGTKDKSIRVPSYFWISVPVFDGGPLYSVKCWFRYRMRDGDLGLTFEMHRPHIARRLAIEESVAKISAALSSPVYLGTP